ncbi:uncharacterized protein RCC_02737 [Ramularia collo-cygni]|uniref:Phosphatidylinositol-specific phospholipase C X domain-containing protein n=1 Tax=Ramularia collo-cygni TaxID=112498 RepID=A0A2D3UMT5_9PEZI|nr:uncharacterized protein RCC_02737 [Ramularia collo-cygni]CZT16902.1 uncharacterized protein RCC_02737 [Ramularia collo-cygni]
MATTFPTDDQPHYSGPFTHSGIALTPNYITSLIHATDIGRVKDVQEQVSLIVINQSDAQLLRVTVSMVAKKNNMMSHWRRAKLEYADSCETGLEKGYESIKEIDTPDDDQNPPESLGEDWMSRLNDDRLMSSLSIPGTHDSATYTRPWPFVSTQDLSIQEQLNSGIRYFDLRVGLRNDVPEMCHGVAFLGLQLSDVLDVMYAFLEQHPREAIIVQIKQDRKAQKSTIHFSHAIVQAISLRRERWRTANTTPTLAELRGRIQLFRRFTGPSLFAYGIDVSQWQDNPAEPFTICNKVQLVTVQDHYSCSDPKSLPSLIDSKGGDVANLLKRAAEDPDPEHWYVNFTSAFEVNFFFQIPPKSIAVGGYYLLRWIDGMNARVEAYLQDRAGGKRYGIVAMDFPELGAKELISLIVLSNFKRESNFHRRPLLVFLCLSMLVVVSILGYGKWHLCEDFARDLSPTLGRVES